VPDFKFPNLKIDSSHRTVESELKCDRLQPIAKAFSRNIDRIDSLISMPSAIAYWAGFLGSYYASAIHRITGTQFEYEARITPEQNTEIMLDVTARMTPTLKKFVENPGPFIGLVREEGDNNVAALNDHLGGAFSGAIESILSTVIVGTWTAFEVMSADLWIASVNESPDPLASLTGDADRISDLNRGAKKGNVATPDNQEEIDDDILDRLSESSDKTIKIGEMHRVTRGRFDLSQHMGDLLSQTVHAELSGLKKIRSAYSKAFTEKAKRVRPNKIDEILADKRLDVLYAVRNLMVHAGGICDDDYIDAIASISGAPKIDKGLPIKLDGESTCSLSGPVVGLASNLLKGVDRWLINTKK
jgi:hypothetical protein